MGSGILPPRSQNPEAVQSSVGRMARPGDSENRVVEGGGREATTSGEVDANAMADDCTDCGKNGYTMLREISEATG